MSVVTCNPRSFLGLNDEKTEPLGGGTLAAVH